MKKFIRLLFHPPYKPVTLFVLAALLFALPIATFAAPLVQELPPAPENSALGEALLYGITILVGLLGSSLSQFLKDKLGLELKWALLLTYAVSFVLAGVQMAVLGWFDPELFSEANLPTIFTTLFTSATFWYQFFVKPRSDAVG